VFLWLKFLRQQRTDERKNVSDLISQFAIKDLIPLGPPGGFTFTNSAFFMSLAVGGAASFILFATRKQSFIPDRWQMAAEMIYNFVADTIREFMGPKGMIFFPLVFSLFSFILMCNVLGLLPGAFTVTSHISITGALAILVISLVLLVGLMHHGLSFFKIFVPSGAPSWALPIIVLIEIASFLSRPLSLSIRLFANMLAGHIALKIFAGFVGTLLSAGLWMVLAPLPLLLTVALTGLETLVACLQAYIFMVLTCVYLKDALEGGH
jgi:F-type H+-transporting ATPase subunit a